MSIETVDPTNIRVKLLPHQWRAWTADEPYVALVTGVGAGKTWLIVRWILKRAIKFPESIHMITANSYPQLRDRVEPELIKACEEWGLTFRWMKGDHNLFVRIGKREVEIRARSCNTSTVDQVMRGVEIGSWAGDEVRDMSAYSVQVILGRLRCTKVDIPRYMWGTTPNGYDHIWERHVDREDPRCLMVEGSTRDNKHLPQSYADGLKLDYDERTYQQEVEGKFLPVGTGLVYYPFDRSVNVRSLEYNPGLPLILCVDFNVDPMCWVVCQEPGMDEVHVLGEVVVRNAGISDACAALAESWGDHRGEWMVYGDATGSSRTAQTGRTHYAVLMDSLEVHGIRSAKLIKASSNPPIKDRIGAVNSLIRNAAGTSRLFVDSSCKELIKDFERVVWDTQGVKEKQDSSSDDAKMRTHLISALGYMIHYAHRPQAFKSQPGWRMRDEPHSRSMRKRYAHA